MSNKGAHTGGRTLVRAAVRSKGLELTAFTLLRSSRRAEPATKPSSGSWCRYTPKVLKGGRGLIGLRGNPKFKVHSRGDLFTRGELKSEEGEKGRTHVLCGTNEAFAIDVHLRVLVAS